MAVKNFCSTHHLYFSDSKCPLCEKERIGKIVTKFNKGKTPKQEMLTKKRFGKIIK